MRYKDSIIYPMKINSKKIERELKRLGWTRNQLAEEMGKTRQWVYFVMTNNKSHTFKTVERFASALGVDSKDLVL